MYSEVCVICAKSSMIWGCAHFAYLSLESNTDRPHANREREREREGERE